MDDDWNIKKFGIDCWETGDPDSMWKTYHEKYIQKLREKLIDDFKEIAQGESPDNVVWVETLLCDIIDMINKRFGIDDE